MTEEIKGAFPQGQVYATEEQLNTAALSKVLRKRRIDMKDKINRKLKRDPVNYFYKLFKRHFPEG